MNYVNDSDFRAKLLAICDDIFVQDGKIMKAIDMQGHGSDFDEIVSTDENDPKYAVQVAAWRLYEKLKSLCTDGQPHRMALVPQHRRCSNCGYGRR